MKVKEGATEEECVARHTPLPKPAKQLLQHSKMILPAVTIYHYSL